MNRTLFIIKGMRKILLILMLIACLPVKAITSGDKAVRYLRKEFANYLRSEKLVVRDVEDDKGLVRHYFKYICNEKEAADTGFVFSELSRLEQAFGTCSAVATEMHRSQEVMPTYDRDVYRLVRTGARHLLFPIFRSHYQVATFNHADGSKRHFILAWQKDKFTDSKGLPFCCINGFVMEADGDEWKIERQAIRNNEAKEEKSIDTLRYEELKRKLTNLKTLYQESKDDSLKGDAYAYMIYSLCEKFDTGIEQKQYLELCDIIDDLLATPVRSGLPTYGQRTDLFCKASMVIDDNVIGYRFTSKASAFYTNGGPIQKESMARRLSHKYHLDSAILADMPLCDITLDYDTRKIKDIGNTRYVDARVFPGFYKGYKPLDEGRSSLHLSYRIPKDMFIEFEYGNMFRWKWVLLSDSVPVKMDMATGTMVGSDINKRFVGYQKRIMRLLPELKKSMIHGFGRRLIIDRKSYDAVVDSIREIEWQAIAENKDNMIPAYYLSKIYYELPFEKLRSVMLHDSPYAGHYLMQPVWKYYNGLQKESTVANKKGRFALKSCIPL